MLFPLDAINQLVQPLAQAGERLVLADFIRIVDVCLQPGKQRGQVLLGIADKTALPALQLAFPRPQRRR